MQHEAVPGMTIPTHAIVVGLDSSPQGGAALEWAAGETRARQLPLHLMHAVQPPLWPAPLQPSDLDDAPASCVTEARRALVATFPDLRVSWSQPDGAALPALTWASRYATLLVVGTRAHGPIRQVLSGSTAVELIADAHCPVVVLRGAPEEQHRSGPIVVGLEGRASDGDALGAAFREADTHQRTLVAVHASDYGYMERIRIQHLVATVHRNYRTVAVKVLVKQGDPAQLLIGRSKQASVLVLGAHGRHEAAGVVLGSVSQSVLRHTGCPVLVARRGTLRPFGTLPETAGSRSHGR